MEFQSTRIENKDLCNVLLKWVSTVFLFEQKLITKTNSAYW